MRRVYMDHAAGMPVDEHVLETMRPYFTRNYGNPSSVHSFGNEARNAIGEARGKVAGLIGAEKEDEVIFTSGGTESNNLAIEGLAYRNKSKGNHIITSSIEHMSVINTCKDLSKQGFEVTFLPVDKYGIVDVRVLEREITGQNDSSLHNVREWRDWNDRTNKRDWRNRP